MSTPSHQTVRLSKGKHSSPENGACVMELASMLAGEPFTDHPQSVCPVIGSFLRAYNDSVDNEKRQDLYAYAAMVVGTRASAQVQRARAERLAQWCDQMRSTHWTRVLIPRMLLALATRRQPPVEAVGTHAVRAIRRHTDQTHGEVLALIDELLEIGRRTETAVATREQPRSERTLATLN
jgi:hypothetical protein